MGQLRKETTVESSLLGGVCLRSCLVQFKADIFASLGCDLAASTLVSSVVERE